MSVIRSASQAGPATGTSMAAIDTSNDATAKPIDHQCALIAAQMIVPSLPIWLSQLTTLKIDSMQLLWLLPVVTMLRIPGSKLAIFFKTFARLVAENRMPNTDITMPMTDAATEMHQRVLASSSAAGDLSTS